MTLQETLQEMQDEQNEQEIGEYIEEQASHIITRLQNDYGTEPIDVYDVQMACEHTATEKQLQDVSLADQLTIIEQAGYEESMCKRGTLKHSVRNIAVLALNEMLYEEVMSRGEQDTIRFPE